jgi:dipeptidase D
MLSREDTAALGGDQGAAAVWEAFYDLSRIPRVSKHEEAILNHIKGLADAQGLQHRSDQAGNLVVLRPGSGAGQGAATVCVQAHVDMVCEKNDDVQVGT